MKRRTRTTEFTRSLRSTMVVAAACAAVCCELAAQPATEGREMEKQLRVVRDEKHLFIRSAFSPGKDLVLRVGKGSNRQVNFSGTWLVNSSAGMSAAELSRGALIHGNGDDSTPWNINGTYIGANHGCSNMRQITAKGHGLTTADLGSTWTDAAGTEFYVIRIVDADKLWFLARNTGKGSVWQLKTTVSGDALTRTEGKATLEVAEVAMAQLRPACRIRSQQYLVDGRESLKHDTPVTCNHLDVVEEYDIINPASLLEDIAAHPGEERDFAAEHLDGVIRNHIVYRFHANGATVIYYTAKALQEFRLGYMGFIQSAKLATGAYDSHEYYIPKTIPFRQDDIDYDFRRLQDYSSRLPSPIRFRAPAKNIEDPANLPDRFLQFLGRRDGDKTVRDVGYAIGYSLLTGVTKPEARAKNADSAIMLYTSSKSYPVAVDSKMGPMIPAGTDFYCIAYRHYFHPAAQPNATAVYWHEENDDTVVYADYHKAVNGDVLKLPAEFAGRSLTVVEKTPSVTLHTSGTVPKTGVAVSVRGDYGYIVFRLR
jgi:hypothetical protein